MGFWFYFWPAAMAVVSLVLLYGQLTIDWWRERRC